MKKIAILSDTHGYLDQRLLPYLEAADEIWHAGDIGSTEVLEQLRALKPVKAVWGNIDGYDVRYMTDQLLRFRCEDVDVLLTHIGGYPTHYAPQVRELLYRNPPQLFVCGHSHILKVQYEKTLRLLHLNPGAAGKYGFHTVQTMLRCCIDGSKIEDLEIIELQRK